MPWLFIDFHLIRFLLFILGFGLLRGAAHGDPQAIVICGVCAGLLWRRPLLDAARQVRDAVYLVVCTVEWAWGRLFRQPLPGPAIPRARGGRRPASRPTRQRRPARANGRRSSAAPSFAGAPPAAPTRVPASRSRLGKPANARVTWAPMPQWAAQQPQGIQQRKLAPCVQIEHTSRSSLSLDVIGLDQHLGRYVPRPMQLECLFLGERATAAQHLGGSWTRSKHPG